MSIGRTVVRALFSSFLLFASPASAYEAEAHADSLTFIAGPDGQMRIFIPVPLSGACDVPWCEDPDCVRNCAVDWLLLSDYVIELVFDGEEASRQIELAVYPVTTFWDPDSVSWDFPWETPGGDIFLSRMWRDKETLYSGNKKERARFFVLDAVREASRAGHSIYGFALTAPIPRGVEESETGLLAQEVAEIGKVEEVHFRLDFHLGVAPEPPPPVEVIEVIDEVIEVVPPEPSPVLSDAKGKGHSIPSGKGSGPVIKPPTPPPPPPPPPPRTPTQEQKAPDPPPPPRTPTQEQKAPDPPPPPPQTPTQEQKAPDPPAPPPQTPTQEQKAPDPPPADENEDADPPPDDAQDLPKAKPAGD